jgi:cobalt/nickel transport system permease protein
VEAVRENWLSCLPLVTRQCLMSFIERNVSTFVAAVEHALCAEELAKEDGLLQRLDPRIKVIGILLLVIAAAMAHRLWVIGAAFAIALLLAVSSRVSLAMLAKRVWFPVLLFTGIIALPAPLVVSGRAVCRLPWFDWPVTAQGLTSAGYLVTRVETAATLSVLLIFCTPWGHVLKALRVLGVPVLFVVILGTAYRYVFLLLESARDMLESRRSRVVGELPGPTRRRLAAATAGVLMSRTLEMSGDVYGAMLARGFRGEVHVLDDFKIAALDWVMLGVFVALASGAFYCGR